MGACVRGVFCGVGAVISLVWEIGTFADIVGDDEESAVCDVGDGVGMEEKAGKERVKGKPASTSPASA